MAALNHAVEVSVGCSYKPEFTSFFRSSPLLPEASLLRHAQERLLDGKGHFTHFIQEQCSPVGALAVVVDGPGEERLAGPRFTGNEPIGVTAGRTFSAG
jgi:hypothetical protein